ncbi:MAG: hypothetical protein QOC60_1955 [Frankiaceae bacterium]|jgi:hypothetical protein|nr:hypothetical protein [Frankiaceae bacterium]
MTASLDNFVRPAFASSASAVALTPLALAQRLARIPGLRDQLPLPDGDRRWLKLPTDAGWDAWLIGWPPGTRTGWHDHQGSAGAFVPLLGELTEWSVPAADRVSRTLGDAAVHASYDEVRIRRFRAGAGRGFADHHIHEMANLTDQPAYSLHAYTPELTAMASYEWIHGRLTSVGLETSDSW